MAGKLLPHSERLTKRLDLHGFSAAGLRPIVYGAADWQACRPGPRAQFRRSAPDAAYPVQLFGEQLDVERVAADEQPFAEANRPRSLIRIPLRVRRSARYTSYRRRPDRFAVAMTGNAKRISRMRRASGPRTDITCPDSPRSDFAGGAMAGTRPKSGRKPAATVQACQTSDV
jgi:hypothetical protein